MTQPERIAWIGTGVMGTPMCQHLLAAGHHVVVHSRTRSKAQPLLEGGARWAASPRAAAEGATVVCTMVGFPTDVRAVYLEDDGVLAGVGQGALAIDFTTTSPSLAVDLHARAEARGVSTIDAPVSGGDVGARAATLSIMVGGARDAFDRALPLLRTLGRNVVYEGGPGAGQHTKLCNQTVIAGTMIGVCESLIYARRAGLDPETVLEAIGGGAASCWALTHLAPRMIARDFAPGFYVDHFVKDLGLVLDASRRMGLSLPGLALAETLYRRVQTLGHGRLGTQALILALEDVNDQAPDP